ncbi:MAG: hypothetical protein UY89_C0029G0005 [Parcubacteria group bacterium GW2011_GWA1_54_9]|nr:MAG: hypothetical protein UY89_C0029G0005 [Parcubacteria group bacterium GW2011_GWA1_54_9]KKW41431.1 MAG: hypothetical protein UY91_C0018G0005 [Parcubacteria group bacterium GW2011_GWB1_55_9]
MNDQPLQAFSPPTFLFSYLPSGVSSGAMVQWVLYIVFAFWALYTLVAIYHWLKYSHASWVAFPAIALHLFVSFALIAYSLSGTLIIV